MLLFGHRFIPHHIFFHISDIESIEKTPPASQLYLQFKESNLDIIEHLQQNGLNFALKVANIAEVVYASALGANFIVVDLEIAKEAQNIAENYLFDAKVLVHATKENAIEEVAILGIDGIIFPEAIVKVSS